MLNRFKKVNKGVNRLLLTVMIVLYISSLIEILDTVETAPPLQIFFYTLIFWGVGLLVYRVILWIYDGFKKSK
jgi:hypothetical protein